MITKRKIITDFSIYYLRKDFTIIVTFGKTGEVQVIHEELPVMGHGATYEEAIVDFCDTFDIQYEGLAMHPDDKLTKDALRAKKLFHELVEGVFKVNERAYTHSMYRPDEEITAKIPEETLKKARKMGRRK